MNILIFSLTILVVYGILVYAYSAWKKVDNAEKMTEIEEIEIRHAEILEFKKAHKGNLNKKREAIERFENE